MSFRFWLCSLLACLFVACAPQTTDTVDEAEEGLNGTECTGSKVKPFATFKSLPQDFDFAGNAELGPNPWWVNPNEMTAAYGQSGCTRAALFDVQNYATGGSGSMRSIVPNGQLLTDWNGHGGIFPWRDPEIRRLRLYLYVYRKFGDGSWSYIGRLVARPHQLRAGGEWRQPQIVWTGSLGGIYANDNPGNIMWLNDNGYYRFATSLRQFPGEDDTTAFVEERISIFSSTNGDLFL